MARKIPAVITDVEGISRLSLPGQVVLAGGAFDLLHPGHIEYLQEASTLGDTLVVHLVGDKRVREKKGPTRPIVSEKDRAFIIASIGCVDYVVIYDGRQFDASLVNAVRPNIYYMSEEGNPEHVVEVESALKGFDGEVFISKLPKISNTSDIINRIKTIDN
jgi:D-beta-D-heptose 7-phosphate kinase / D-beta-D-heptose 1-phosphate adenosyltransferase